MFWDWLKSNDKCFLKEKTGKLFKKMFPCRRLADLSAPGAGRPLLR